MYLLLVYCAWWSSDRWKWEVDWVMGESEELEIIGRALPKEHVGDRGEWVWVSLSEDAFDIICVFKYKQKF